MLTLRIHILFLMLVCAAAVDAQRLYQISGVPVSRGGATLANGWCGGFNNPVISPADLNQDSLTDLFIYDKAGWKAEAFLNSGSAGHPSYRYAPEYDVVFPTGMQDWALMRDYDRDGVPDIFAYTGISNITVYHGRRIAGGGLAFDLIVPRLTYTYGISGVDGIFVNADNMPVLADVDYDGDMDIMTADMSGSRITLYRNRSAELGYGADSLIYVNADGCWGNIYMNSGCGVSFFSCKAGDMPAGSPAQAGQRDGGGTLYAFDYEGDHDMDILLADMTCSTIKFFRNDGDSVNPVVGYTDTLYPSYDHSVKMPIYPATYGADADNDGYADMLVAPFMSNNLYLIKSEDVKCLQYYHNDGPVAPLNRFQYQGDSLLTSTTADIGTESHASFFDYNGDGLTDIVLGKYGRYHGWPQLALYVNVGTIDSPSYNEVTQDWSALSVYVLSGAYPAFGDMDGDGHADMVIGTQTGELDYFRNAGTDTASFPSMTQPSWFGINAGTGAAPYIFDLNGDSLNDILVGGTSGKVRYYWNFGTRSSPQFSPDSVNTSLGNIYIHSVPIQTLEYSSPFADVEQGNTYLYSGSRQGAVAKYRVDQDSLRHGAFALVKGDVIGISGGQHSTVAIADINHDGYNDYLLGNARGGMMLFSDVYWGDGTTLPTAIKEVSTDGDEILAYPVPASTELRVKATSTDHYVTSADLYDMEGRNVATAVTNGGDTIIDLGGLSAGIYVLIATDSRGYIYRTRIDVVK